MIEYKHLDEFKMTTDSFIQIDKISDNSIKVESNKTIKNLSPNLEIKININQEDMNFLKNLLYQVKRNPYQEYSNPENEKNQLLYQHLADRMFNFLMCQ
jgi:hypothetical protein